MTYGTSLIDYLTLLRRERFSPVGRSVNQFAKYREAPQGNEATVVFIAVDGAFTAYNHEGQEIGRGKETWELEALL